MLGKEPMAYDYGDDDDWVGLNIIDVETYVETQFVNLGPTRSYTQFLSFDLDGFAGWGPFEAWSDECKEAALKMREEVAAKQAEEARADARGDDSLADYRVTFTVEYETFMKAPRGVPYATLLDMAEEVYAEGTDWTLVSHTVDLIEGMTDE